MFRDAIELLKSPLGKGPERLDAIDVRLRGRELMRSVLEAEMVGVAHVNEPVVAGPSIRVNDSVQGNMAANNAPERPLTAIRHDLSGTISV